jgi:hypothetical protein
MFPRLLSNYILHYYLFCSVADGAEVFDVRLLSVLSAVRAENGQIHYGQVGAPYTAAGAGHSTFTSQNPVTFSFCAGRRITPRDLLRVLRESDGALVLCHVELHAYH